MFSLPKIGVCNVSFRKPILIREDALTMKQNNYDNPNLFSVPDLKGENVLDLGCGFGWHCRHAREQEASSVVGVDISENMIQRAREITNDSLISYMDGEGFYFGN